MWGCYVISGSYIFVLRFSLVIINILLLLIKTITFFYIL